MLYPRADAKIEKNFIFEKNIEAMLRKPKILLVPIISLLLCSCMGRDLYLENYTLAFYKPTSFMTYSSSDGTMVSVYPEKYSHFCFDSEGEERKEFKRLCEYYGDVGYDRVDFVSYRKPWRTVLYPDLFKIDVICSTDYDGRHPAGSSLADVATLRYCSAYNYVTGGYDSSAMPKEKKVRLSEVAPEDLRMLMNGEDEFYPYLGFTFPSAIISGELTFELTFSDGSVLTCTATFPELQQ